MTPDATRMLTGIAAALARDLLPELRTPFAQQTAGLAGMALSLLAQEYDRSAARRAQEISAIRTLLGQARPVVDDASIRDRIDAALELAPDADLRISALQAANDRLRALLIDVHAAVESLGTPEAKQLDERIWEELRESTRRRHLQPRM